jgi:hypothetical protein
VSEAFLPRILSHTFSTPRDSMMDISMSFITHSITHSLSLTLWTTQWLIISEHISHSFTYSLTPLTPVAEVLTDLQHFGGKTKQIWLYSFSFLEQKYNKSLMIKTFRCSVIVST